MSWGVQPLLMDLSKNTDELFDHAVDVALKAGFFKNGDVVVVTAGVPLGVSGTTNQIKVAVAGHVLVRGKGANGNAVSANVCVASSPKTLKNEFHAGDIIVAEDTSNELLPEIRQCSGLIIESASMNAHGVIAGMSLDLPVIREAKNATEILKSGTYVKMDPRKGTVSAETK